MQVEPIEMTIPLWGVTVFIVWTIMIVVLLLIVRIQHLVNGGSAKDFGTPNDASLLWRLFRVQANLAENLPLYIGVVFLLTIRDISGTANQWASLCVYHISDCAFSDSHCWAQSQLATG